MSGTVKKKKFENSVALDKNSRSYRANAFLEDYLTGQELIRAIVTTVSTGGNVLVNVGPTPNGIIEPILVERLRAMGSWLKINGEAIYHSQPWTYLYDPKTADVWYTSKPVAANHTIVYAIVLKYPYKNSEIIVHSLSHQFEVIEVRLLGYSDEIEVR